MQGGTECAVCTALIGIFEQLAVINPAPIIDIMEEYCLNLPEPPQSACIEFVNTYGRGAEGARVRMVAWERLIEATAAPRTAGPAIVEGWVARNTADMICRNLGICIDPTCNLFPLPPPDVQSVEWKGREAALANGKKFAPCDQPIISEWCRALEDFVDIHTPLFDEDRDRHSTFPTFRGPFPYPPAPSIPALSAHVHLANWHTIPGSHWRGKDCDETRNDVYPGRQSSLYGPDIDHNCNGIAGVDEVGPPMKGGLGGGLSPQAKSSTLALGKAHRACMMPQTSRPWTDGVLATDM